MTRLLNGFFLTKCHYQLQARVRFVLRTRQQRNLRRLVSICSTPKDLPRVTVFVMAVVVGLLVLATLVVAVVFAALDDLSNKARVI